MKKEIIIGSEVLLGNIKCKVIGRCEDFYVVEDNNNKIYTAFENELKLLALY